MEKKNNNLVIILMGVIIVILAVLCVLFATDTINLKNNGSSNEIINETNENSNTPSEVVNSYKYSDLKGLYSFKSDVLKDESGNEFTAWYSLYLYENGTYQYRMGTMAPFGTMGNYIIEDNKIILNYLFSTNSGAGIEVTKGTKTITIIDNNSLSDTVEFPNELSNKNIILSKANESEATEFLKNNDFEKYLNDSHISNNVQR